MSEPEERSSSVDAADGAFEVHENLDRLEIENRVVRRHFWRRLLPGVGITSYMGAHMIVAPSALGILATAGFAFFTAWEGRTFRANLERLRGLERDLAVLTGGARTKDLGPPEAV